MKKLTVLLLVLAGFSTIIYAQSIPEEDVPRKVQDAFIAYFPSATDVTWSEEGENLYEAEFSSEDVKHTIVIHQEGQVRTVITELSYKSLPEKVKRLIKADFPEFEVLKATRVVNQIVPSYEIRLQKSDEVYDVTFNSNGQITEKTKVEE